jgi:hypothetical protein
MIGARSSNKNGGLRRRGIEKISPSNELIEDGGVEDVIVIYDDRSDLDLQFE